MSRLAARGAGTGGPGHRNADLQSGRRFHPTLIAPISGADSRAGRMPMAEGPLHAPDDAPFLGCRGQAPRRASQAHRHCAGPPAPAPAQALRAGCRPVTGSGPASGRPRPGTRLSAGHRLRLGSALSRHSVAPFLARYRRRRCPPTAEGTPLRCRARAIARGDMRQDPDPFFTPGSPGALSGEPASRRRSRVGSRRGATRGTRRAAAGAISWRQGAGRHQRQGGATPATRRGTPPSGARRVISWRHRAGPPDNLRVARPGPAHHPWRAAPTCCSAGRRPVLRAEERPVGPDSDPA